MSVPGDEYQMNHSKRGLALIFNNENFQNLPRRIGTNTDRDRIKEKLEGLYFEVISYDDLTRRDMKEKIVEVAQKDHDNNDCFVCVVLSHGEEGAVFGTDRSLDIHELVNPFKGHKSLAGKPKLFFIQACRGVEFDDGVEVTDALGVKGDDGEEKEVTYRIPTEADFLIAYCVVPGKYAWRNEARGSWFIQALCRVLEEHGTTLDLMTMMTRVNKIVAYEFESKAEGPMRGKKQIPCITSMLTRDVYFRPKN